MQVEELFKEFNKQLDIKGVVSNAISEQLAPLLEVESKKIMDKVQSHNQLSVGGYGLVRTAQGSLINPSALKNVQLGQQAKYWHILSPVMEEFMTDFKAKTMTVGDNESGGFTVPEEFVASIVQYQEPQNVVWPRATIQPMKTDRLRMPKLAQVSAGTVNHFGGVVMTWTGEAGPKTGTEPSFESLALNAHELSGYIPVSDTLLADAPLNLANFLTNLLGRAWMWTTDFTFLQGNGAAKPMGIINDPAVIIVARQTAGTVVLTDINNMIRALPSHFHPGANWLLDLNTLGLLQNERDTVNALLIRESPYAVTGDLIRTMKGKQVFLSDNKTATLGTQGDVVLGLWPEYIIGDRQRFQVATSIHAMFTSNTTVIRITGRVDGQARQPKAFVILGDVAAGS